MAKLYHVSLPDTEKELIEWIEEKLSKREISLSLVFRDAIKELKKQDDALHSDHNPAILLERIKTLKQTIGRQSEFIQEKGLQEEFFKFNEQKEKEEPKIVEENAQ